MRRLSNTMVSSPASETAASGRDRQLRVAVVCDFLEEHWPSMDLCAEMLLNGLQSLPPGEMSASQVRPRMRKMFQRVPLPGGRKAGRNADRIFNRLVEYPRHVKSMVRDFDIFHIVDHSYSHLLHTLPPERCVVTCHDLDTFQCVLEPARDPRPWWFRSMTGHILDGLREARRIICVSQATRNELLNHFLVPEERVVVVPTCVHPVFSPHASETADRAARQLLGADDGQAVDLLHVGSTIARKRIEDLLTLFAGIRRKYPKARLIRVGGRFTGSQERLVGSLGIPQDAIVVLPYLDRDTLAAVYRRAALVLQTSEREGFGLPLVEAMASGTPVVASAIPVFREIGGAHVRLCPSGSADIWQAAVGDLLDERGRQPELWRIRRSQCVSHARQFGWNKYVERIEQIYRELI